MLAKPIARGLLFALAAAVLVTAITLKHRAGQRSLASPESPAPTAPPLTSELLRRQRSGADQAVDPDRGTAWRKSQERLSDESRAKETSAPLPPERSQRSPPTSMPNGMAKDPSRSGNSSRLIPSRPPSDGAPVH